MKTKVAKEVAKRLLNEEKIILYARDIKTIHKLIKQVKAEFAEDDLPTSFGGVPVAIGSRNIGGCAITMNGQHCAEHSTPVVKDAVVVGITTVSQAAGKAMKELSDAFAAAVPRVQLGAVAEVDTTAQQVESLAEQRAKDDAMASGDHPWNCRCDECTNAKSAYQHGMDKLHNLNMSPQAHDDGCNCHSCRNNKPA